MLDGFSLQAEPRIRARGWLRGFEALRQEFHDERLGLVTGPAVPPELSGTLLRNGSGSNESAGTRNGHWFDGDGMVVAFRFSGGEVSFGNRYVRTDDYLNERRSGRRLLPRGGTLSSQRWRNALPRLHNSANVNVIAHAGRLLALSDLGRPIRLDPRSLETLGEETFDGALRTQLLGMFPAHPHLDAASGALVNLTSRTTPQMFTRPHWQVVEVSARGELRETVRFGVDRPFWSHDFALTQRKVVVFGAPRYLEPRRLARVFTGRAPFLTGLGYHPEEPMLAYVVDRQRQGHVHKYELPPGLVQHFANAFDDGDDVVVDSVLYPDDSSFTLVDAFFRGEASQAEVGLLTRTRLSPDGGVHQQVLCPLGMEMPTVALDRSARRHRYVYATRVLPELPVGNSILKVDTDTREAVELSFGAGHFASEPVFAKAPGGTREDDGWVLTLVYDSEAHRSYLAIADARELRAPVTKVHLPVHVPFGFHGGFYPDVSELSAS